MPDIPPSPLGSDAEPIPDPLPDLTLVVLAAGSGKRMVSRLPKPLHHVAGRPMIEHVLLAGQAAGRAIVVVSQRLADLADRLPGIPLTTVVQDQPLGTGDAVARVFDRPELLPESGLMLVLLGDQPLLDGETVQKLAAAASVVPGHLVTLLTCVPPDSFGYGRIARDGNGNPTRIVEHGEDDLENRTGPVEVWSGAMALDLAWARTAIRQLTPSAVNGELYLTQLIGIAVAERQETAPWPIGVMSAGTEFALGVNNRFQLAEAERLYRERVRRHLMGKVGVSMPDPMSVYIDADVTIGMDTVIHPNTHIRAGTTIGEGCVIGPDTTVSRSTIGDGVTIRSSTVDGVTIEQGVDIGPYSHVRPGTHIGAEVHIGNFGEFKNARLATGVKVGHFGYLGDVTVGEGTNIGAGTVVANYDGQTKHQTTIGAGAFIGSDTVLRAPVTIGDGAATGAGSVVTRDVAAGQTVAGVPARPLGERRTTGVASANRDDQTTDSEG